MFLLEIRTYPGVSAETSLAWPLPAALILVSHGLYFYKPTAIAANN
jgi:hypothetical protein